MNKTNHDRSHQISWCLRWLDGDDTTTFRLYEDWCPNSREYRRHGWLGNRSYHRPRSNDKKFF
jgi:hypothetical protein